jgi:hypothetical protein
MTTPIHAVPEIAGPSTAGKEEIVNEGLRYLEQGANWFLFKSRATTAQPGSPSDGDCYLLPASPTGTDWSGNGGKIARRINTAWVFLTAKEGMAGYVADEDVAITFNGTSWGTVGGGGTIRIGFFFTTAPTSSEVLLLNVATDAFILPANLAGARVSVGTNPAATFALDVRKNGSTVGTISISTGGVATLTTSGGSAVSFAAGDVLSVLGPASVDASIANVAVTLRGTI